MQKLLVIVMLFITLPVLAQDKSLYQKQWFIQNGDTMPYRIMFPINFDSSKTYPVVFFLHGRGESGNDNEKQLTHGWKFFANDSARREHPAIVVFPQCDNKSYWANVQMIAHEKSTGKRTFYFVPDGPPSVPMTMLMQLVDNIMTRFKIDERRVYVGGLSMGGMGTYELVRRKPKTFAAAFAICGGAHPGTAREIRRTKWWLFHGMKDDVVLPEYTQQMEAALKKARADVRATYYPNANHNSWDPAFAEPGLLDWLYAQRRK
ncbi:alpha/beta hydrolase-fold protein [Aridibaculum aurantiacum]|uniref:carboxylesterase family protein n=1 Tax=Aridibaculum aurantiacum TaxID=2810307 RepID=UPI001A96864F|nr:alpha/beta hydrolase-fold protein [Aridibaculum aurantiacum]